LTTLLCFTRAASQAQRNVLQSCPQQAPHQSTPPNESSKQPIREEQQTPRQRKTANIPPEGNSKHLTLGNSMNRAPTVSHKQQAGARYMRPSMG
jgi:hypothetical protein